jgi:hypothetical protein
MNHPTDQHPCDQDSRECTPETSEKAPDDAERDPQPPQDEAEPERVLSPTLRAKLARRRQCGSSGFR